MAEKKPIPPADFDENPEWTDADFKAARPASEVLPELLGAGSAAALLRKPGRPKAAGVKVPTKVRLDPDVLAYFRAKGRGWQTRINETLRADMEREKRTSKERSS